MSMQQAVRQKPASAGRVAVADGEAVRAAISDEACGPRHKIGNAGSALLLAALTRENLQQAFKRVRANKGAAGVDGLDINETARHLVTAWPAIREQLLLGVYRPWPVRRVTIPKPDGCGRELGIPTVTDRLIQQALLQVLQPILDPAFSQYSFGFRPRRCANSGANWTRIPRQTGQGGLLSSYLCLISFDKRISRMVMDRFKIFRFDDVGVDAVIGIQRSRHITHHILDKFGIIVGVLGDEFFIGAF